MKFAVIGGGFAGAAVALQLARQAPAGMLPEIHLVEPAADAGPGTAYATPFARHVLNVPRDNMGVLAHEPSHFDTWMRRHHPTVTARFVERRLYGAYLSACLAGVPIHHHRARALDIDPVGPTVILDDGTRLTVDRVALCLGSRSALPEALRAAQALAPDRVITQPWQWDAWQKLPASGEVFVLGVGLTMVDVVLALEERGFAGRVTAMSRHGLRPLPHLETPVAPWPAPLPAEPCLRDILHALRAAARAGVPWQAAIDGLRSRTSTLWQGLQVRERARFWRSVRTHWECHRHRVAPEVDAQLRACLASGMLCLQAGRLKRVEVDRTGTLQLSIAPRGTGTVVRQAASFLVNTTGHLHDWSAGDCALRAALLQRGLVQPDPLRLGIGAAPSGAVLGPTGRPSSWLSVVGAALVGRDLEATAVPDLRRQAEATVAAWMQPTPAGAVSECRAE